MPLTALPGFITSQGDTAPKQWEPLVEVFRRFITSQGDTAPKQLRQALSPPSRFITSQGDTAPKRRHVRQSVRPVSLPVRVTLLQNPGSFQIVRSPFHYQSG